MHTISRSILNLVSAAMISSAIAAETPKPDGILFRTLRETELPSVYFMDITLGEACDFMASRLRDLGKEHREIPIEAKDAETAKRKIIGLRVEGVPFGVALAYLADFTGTTLSIEGGKIGFSLGDNAKKKGGTPADFANPKAMPHPDPAKARIATIELRDTSFQDAIRVMEDNWRQSVGHKGPINIICLTDPDEIPGIRHLKLDNKTAREVLEEMAKATGTRVVFAAHAVEFRPAEAKPAEAK